ncbi:hypothetical protein NNO_2081 [Hydrogenimonas sp.]|nr:hypothetical protein NNO_2081 [Hydrogenimonas sp.]
MHFNGLGEQHKFQGWIDKSRAKGYVDRELYRLKRYGSPVTIGLFRSADPNFAEKFSSYSRMTDHLVPLAERHYLFLLDHTEISGAVKAVENLLIHIDSSTDKERVALTQLKEEDDLEGAIKRLLTLFSIAARSKDVIVEDSYLER